MYTYAAGSPGTFSSYRGGFGSGFGAFTHEQAQTQAAIDFEAHFGHPLPATSLAEANWLNDRTAALKAVAGVETHVVTKTSTVRQHPSVLGPRRIGEINAALQRVPPIAVLKGKLGSALAAANTMTTASILAAEKLYNEARMIAVNMGQGPLVPPLSPGTTTVTTKSGGGVPSPPVGTASVIKNLSESLASMFIRNEVPNVPQTVQPVGGNPYLPTRPVGAVQTSAPGVLQQRIAGVTVANIAMVGGGALALVGIMQKMIPLAIVGGVAAAGVAFMGRR